MHYKLLQAQSLDTSMVLINKAVQEEGATLEGDIVPIVTPISYYREVKNNNVTVNKLNSLYIQKIAVKI